MNKNYGQVLWTKTMDKNYEQKQWTRTMNKNYGQELWTKTLNKNYVLDLYVQKLRANIANMNFKQEHFVDCVISFIVQYYRELERKCLFASIFIFLLYINLACLSVCLFVSNKRQNGWTDRAQIFCGTSRKPREGLWMIKILKICV